VTASESLERIAGAVQALAGVESVWIAGSVKTGLDDAVSDLDLWLKCADWDPKCVPGLFLAGRVMPFGDAPLFHGIDQEGLIVDVRFGPNPPSEYDLLPTFPTPVTPPGPFEEPSLFTDFWISSYKHRKPVFRGVDALAVFGLHFDRMWLIRAWVLQETGTDPGNEVFTIHGLTPLVRSHLGPQRMALLGAPARNRPELLAAIEANRKEMFSLTPPDSKLAQLVMDDPIFLALKSGETVT
jgi:hypothetical protein